MSSQQPWDYIAKLVCIGDSSTGKSSLTIRLCENRFISSHDVTIGVEFGSRIVPVGPPASLALNINNPSSTSHQTPPSSQPRSAISSTQKEPPPSSNTATSKSLPHPRLNPSTQKHMKLSLWDTAGQETYKSITRSYFRGASGALLVFDISRRQTFESVTQWLYDLRQIAEEGIVVILVGNKCDLAGSSLVSSSSSPDSAGQGGRDRPQGVGGGGGAGRDTGITPRANEAEEGDGRNNRAVTRTEAEEWCKRNGVMRYVETSAKSGEGVERAFLEVAERIFQNIEAGKYDLNDRRSGVKGPGAGGGGGGGRGGGRGGTGGRGKGGEVVLGVNEVGGMRVGEGKGGWGRCC